VTDDVETGGGGGSRTTSMASVSIEEGGRDSDVGIFGAGTDLKDALARGFAGRRNGHGVRFVGHAQTLELVGLRVLESGRMMRSTPLRS